MPEGMDDRQPDGVAEHLGGLSDEFGLACGTDYGRHKSHCGAPALNTRLRTLNQQLPTLLEGLLWLLYIDETC